MAQVASTVTPVQRLKTIESVAKIFSLIAVPTLVALGGWLIQSSQATRTTSQEYVKLAISVLTQSNGEIDPGLRDWAVDLLNDNSPTRFNATVVADLKAGTVELPKIKVYSDFNDHLNRDLPPEQALEAREKFTRMWLRTTGKNLRDLKIQFQQLGYFKGKPDDAFTNDFVDAVIAFQHAQKLAPEDGICGGDCFKALANVAPRTSASAEPPDLEDDLNTDAPSGMSLEDRERYTRGWLRSRAKSLMEVKDQLQRLGYFNGQLDDSFTEKFVDAVLAFQHDNGLVPEDGICGGDCFGALASVLPNAASVSLRDTPPAP